MNKNRKRNQSIVGLVLVILISTILAACNHSNESQVKFESIDPTISESQLP